jgi:hypothetical protein
MKSHDSGQLQLHDKIIYHRKSKRGWAIVIMPDNIRIDNFHGFSHIHLEFKGKHEPIKYDSFETVLNIIIDHIEINKGLNKKKLRLELAE